MATWITHLRLAEDLLGRIEGLEAAAFAVGNIAPDSGIPDENWETFTPPPEVSHCRIPHETYSLGWNEDMRFCRHDLLPLPRTGDGAEEAFSYRLGYFFHLVTDNLWHQQVGYPTMERFAAEFEADPQFVWEVKRDWYGLDFEYVRSHPRSLFWTVFLGCEYRESYALDFMPPEAVKERIAYIQALYQREDDEVRAHYFDRPDLYLSREEMDRFVEGAVGKLARIYSCLFEAQMDPAGFVSALELV